MSDSSLWDVQSQIAAFCEKLLAAGMTQAATLRFYKQTTPLTAFAINLQADDGYITVTYGYASTAFTQMANNSGALSYGIDDDEITLRERLIICDAADEKTAQTAIQKLHDRYMLTEKDQLLTVAAEKRKAFIGQISSRLKPLGFKKTGNTWRRPLENDYHLIFNLQKSDYGDRYYLNLNIGNDPKNYFMQCFSGRLEPETLSPLDWQGLSFDEMEQLLDKNLLPVLNKMLSTPLSALGKDEFVWKGCLCGHRKCPSCWVERNLWETKGDW